MHTWFEHSVHFMNVLVTAVLTNTPQRIDETLVENESAEAAAHASLHFGQDYRAFLLEENVRIIKVGTVFYQPNLHHHTSSSIQAIMAEE